MEPRLTDSLRYGGQGVFQSFIRRGGVPFGAAVFIMPDRYNGNNSKVASDNHDFHRKCSKNSNVHGDFTPASCAPPNAITPGRVITALSH